MLDFAAQIDGERLRLQDFYDGVNNTGPGRGAELGHLPRDDTVARREQLSRARKAGVVKRTVREITRSQSDCSWI